MAGKGVGDAVGPIKTGINVGQTISETLFPQTKPMFKDYWSGDIAKGVVNSEDGIFTSNFWTGKTTVFRSGGKKFYLKEGEPIMIVVIVAPLGTNQSERSKFSLDQSELSIWTM